MNIRPRLRVPTCTHQYATPTRYPIKPCMQPQANRSRLATFIMHHNYTPPITAHTCRQTRYKIQQVCQLESRAWWDSILPHIELINHLSTTFINARTHIYLSWKHVLKLMRLSTCSNPLQKHYVGWSLLVSPSENISVLILRHMSSSPAYNMCYVHTVSQSQRTIPQPCLLTIILAEFEIKQELQIVNCHLEGICSTTHSLISSRPRAVIIGSDSCNIL